MALDLNEIDEVLNPKEPEWIRPTAYTALGVYGSQRLAKRYLSSLLDTEGYGEHSPNPKYQTGSKIQQVKNNALQAARGTTGNVGTKVQAFKEALKSYATKHPLELSAAESSIADVKRELTNPNLSFKQKEKLELELKSRLKNLPKRQGLAANVKLSLGEKINFNLTPDFTPDKFVVDDQVAKLDPTMKRLVGKEVPGMRHSGQQVRDFKSYALRDSRVRKVTELLSQGKISKAQQAAEDAHHIVGSKTKGTLKTIVPNLNEKGLPINAKGEPMGMNLVKMKDATTGKPFWRLKFVPKIPMGMTSKLEYVVGAHWQYMDFERINGKWTRVRGGMRDIHNLVPNKFKVLARAEQVFGLKPVVNHADWDYNVRGSLTNVKQSMNYEKTIYRTPASRTAYDKVPKASRIVKTTKKAKDFSRLTKLARLAKMIVTKRPF